MTELVGYMYFWYGYKRVTNKPKKKTTTMINLLHKDKEEKGNSPRTKARVWLPFPATVPSQPHTCFSCRPDPLNENFVVN